MLDEKVYQIESILKHSQNYWFDINCKQIINKWYQHKLRFIEMFGGTVYKTPYKLHITLSKQEKEKLFLKFLADLDELNVLNNRTKDNKTSFKDFLLENQETFFDNVTSHNVSRTDIKLQSKLLKNFSLFFNNENILKCVKNLASEYIQKNKITGHLFLSVDPVDFLTLSDNNAKWRSCHSLDGDYRAGNLSYMLDETTIIAYLASDKLVNIKSLPKEIKIYSKKWRMLMHCHPNNNILIYNKQYPFNHKHLVDEAYSIFNNFNNNVFLEPITTSFSKIHIDEKTYNLDCNYFYLPGIQEAIKSTEIINHDILSLNYLDLVRNNGINIVASYNSTKKLHSKDDYKIHIGAATPCVCGCGGYVVDNKSFLCQDCKEKYDIDGDLYPICSCCGRRIYEEDKSYVLDKNELCCSACWKEIKDNKGETLWQNVEM